MKLDDIYLEMSGTEDVDLKAFHFLADPHIYWLTIDEKVIFMFEDLVDIERFIEKLQNEVEIMKRG
jgi:hypothetical protein